MIDLTEKQREDVTRQYVQIVVDGWDMEGLVGYAISQMTAYFNEELDQWDDEDTEAGLDAASYTQETS